MAKGVRNTLDSFVDMLPWPAAVIAASGRVTHVNAAMAALEIDLDPNEKPRFRTLFRHYCDALRGNPPWRTPQQVDVARETARGAMHERVWICPFGSRSCMIVCDETRLHELETGYAQNARLASLGFLLASASHEISNPLSAISSVVQLLESKRGVSSEVRRKGAILIAENVRRLVLITRTLNGFARVDDAARKVFLLDAAIDEAFQQLRHDSLGQAVEFVHRGDSKALVRGYQDQIRQVVLNVLINAARAMNGRGIINVLTQCVAPSGVRVTIGDTGPGIAAAHLARVFEPFFTTSLHDGGVGLGLAICSEIVHEHGGSIAARNGTAGGALFEITLPRAAAAGQMQP